MALRLVSQYEVSHTFLFPTTLKAMMKDDSDPRQHFYLSKLQVIMSDGGFVGDLVTHCCREGLGITVNEMFGQTEINEMVGNSFQRRSVLPGRRGRPCLGHRVSVIDDEGRELGAGKVGEVAVHCNDIH